MSPNHRFVVSLIVVVVLIALGFGSWRFFGRDDGPPAPVAQQQPAPAAGATAPPAPAAPPSPAAEPAPATVAEPEPARGAEPEAVELAFDVVRVEPTGDAVIAGRGAPGARVELLRNGETHDSVVADAAGAFAFAPPPLPAGTSDVSLRATLPGGEVITSRQNVTIVVDAGLTQQPMVALVAPGEATVVLSRPEADAAPTGVGAQTAEAAAPAEPAAAETAVAETAAAETAQSATTEAERSAEPAAPAAPVAENPAQPAAAQPSAAQPAPAPSAAPAPQPRVAVRIASVEAETGGGLFVTGEGAPLAQIRLYLNDTFVARAQTDTAGAVSFEIGRGVMPGAYQVRLDEVADLTGQVLSRAEVSFEVPAFVAAAPEPAPATAPGTAAEPPAGAAAAPPAEVAAPATGGRDPATVTIPEVATAQVTRGDSLWRISRQVYGRGVRYTEIFEANKDQIRDPNLIYPGQIFVLPADSRAAD